MKEGDRVQYIRNKRHRGVIAVMTCDYVKVEWDDGSHTVYRLREVKDTLSQEDVISGTKPD